jgi:hypothetical protein
LNSLGKFWSHSANMVCIPKLTYWKNLIYFPGRSPQ